MGFAPLNVCPQCQKRIPAGARRTAFKRLQCSSCGKQFIPGLLTRTIDYEDPTREDFSRFHVHEGAVANLYLTETIHPAGYRIPPHAHEMPSFYFLLEGSLVEQYGRDNALRNANELVFTPADRPHSNIFQARGGHCLIIELHPAVIARAVECGPLPANLTSFRGRPAWLASRLYHEFRAADAVSPLIVEGVILEIFAEICRHTSRTRTFTAPRKIRQARDFLDAAFAQPFSLADVAQAVDLHPVYLARIFRQTYGSSVGEYLRRRRVDFVCSQLSGSDKPLAQIALDAGFCDQGHLSKTFRKLTGLTPRQFRATRHN